jgi:hypothetical protein
VEAALSPVPVSRMKPLSNGVRTLLRTSRRQGRPFELAVEWPLLLVAFGVITE